MQQRRNAASAANSKNASRNNRKNNAIVTNHRRTMTMAKSQSKSQHLAKKQQQQRHAHQSTQRRLASVARHQPTSYAKAIQKRPIPAPRSSPKRSITTTITRRPIRPHFQQQKEDQSVLQIQQSFAAASFLPSITAAPTPIHTISAHDISTLALSPIQSKLANSSNPALRSLVQSSLVLTPHHSSLTQNAIDTVPVFMPLRGFAADKKSAKGKAAVATKKDKKGGPPVDEDDDGSAAIFAQAGDVKKNLRNWLEQILTSKPEVKPLPQAAIDNEELFVQECQTRFAQRLDKRTRFEQAKIILKQRAIEQLPGELKQAALKNDPALWSMQIMTPWSDPPRKKWLLEHYRIPYKASQEEVDEEEFLKKKYARL